MTRRWRIVLASVMTLWMAGWLPTILYGGRIGEYGPTVYAIWIILAPCALAAIAFAGIGLFYFYRWALARPSREDLQQRISDLERELDIR